MSAEIVPLPAATVHAVLAVISCGFGIAVGVIGWRALRAAREAARPSAGDDGLHADVLEHRAQA